MSAADVQASRDRLARAQAIESESGLEAARRVWWTPPGESTPKKHCADAHPCTCYDGGVPAVDTLCKHCGGICQPDVQANPRNPRSRAKVK